MTRRGWLWVLAVGVGLIGLSLVTKAPQRLRQYIGMSGAHWGNLTPDMQRRAKAVIDALAAQGILVGIPSTGGWRSTAGQEAIPTSNTDVVDPLDSFHVWGQAVDFVPLDAAGVFEWPDWHDPLWQTIGAAIEAQGLEWGGRWKIFKDPVTGEIHGDMPHGEIATPSLAALKAAYTDPVAFITAQADASAGPQVA